MTRKDDNALSAMVQIIKGIWRHRKGNEIPAAILDTFDNLGFMTRDERQPVIVAKKKTDYGWHIIFHLPPGISFSDVKRKKEYFENSTNSWIDILWKHGYLHMNIQTGSIPEKVLYSWDEEPYKAMDLPVPIGISQSRLEVLDLAQSPHMLIAGVPGFGKSNYLHTLIHSLIPRALIGVIDMKRLEFSYLRKHCALAKTEPEALEMMIAINKEMERRITILERAGLVKMQDYPDDSMPFIVLIIDEIAEISDERILYYIDRIVRLARAVGISVVGATQRPSTKVISGETRAMFQARLCFQVADELNSRMVLGESCNQAAYLPTIKGRAIYKFGLVEKEVQTMFLPIATAKKLIIDVPEGEWLHVMSRTKSEHKPQSKRLPPR